MNIQNILEKESLNKQDLICLLSCSKEEEHTLFKFSKQVRDREIGQFVYLRGLIEFSNICSKDCLYCGIRHSNLSVKRYSIDDNQILNAAKFAYDNKYGSIVLQGGERDDKDFIDKIDILIQKIKKLSNNTLGITLSVGEQSKETYERWFKSGAHRYLLRIESSNKDLYNKIHPINNKHSFETRLKCLKDLQNIGYQTGTGVMIGLPEQTIEDLADDLIFFKNFDIDMVGMGPYIEHIDTPLFAKRDLLIPQIDRFNLTLRMIACLRILMKDVNIAAATALQAIDPIGRERAINIGANIIMPNITPTDERVLYQLYQNKPCTDEGADECYSCIEKRIKMANCEVKYSEWGDSIHYKRRKKD